MADNSTLNPGAAGDTIRTKDRGGTKTEIVGLDLTPAGGSETLMNGVMPVNDNSGSLTVDAPVGTPVFVRLSDGSSAIATLPVSLATLPATAADGAAGLPAVQMVIAGWDGTNVQALVTDSTGRLILPPTTQAGATARTSDYDTGAGTDTVLMQGIALPASGGAVQGGTGTNPVRTDPTGSTTQPVSGTVGITANSAVNVAQVAGTTTDTNSGVKSAGTQRVVLATDQPQLTNALKVDGSAVTQPVSGTLGITANSSVNVAQVAGTATSVNSGTKDAGTQRVTLATDQVQLTNALKVDGSAVTQPISGNVTNAGTFAVQSVDTGNIAHDGVDSGNPVKTGARAISADITAVSANDRTDSLATLLGKGLVMPYALPGATVSGSGNKTDTSDLALIAAPGAGVRTYITHITITNAHATVGTKVVLKDGASIIWRGYADALGGGVCTALPTPLRLTAATALNGAAITTGADVDFTVVGYQAAE